MRVGFLITARLKSTRLPLKILKDLNGKPVIERLIDRIKEIKGISEVVICTSTNPQDRPLVDVALKNGIYYFNGDEDDVLQRLLAAAIFFDLDYFIGITADNPLITISHSNMIMDEILTGKYDFIKLEGLPIGAATYGMNVKALRTVCKVKTIVDTEIWGYLINQPDVFDIKTIKVEEKLRRPELRFTLDYAEDHQFLDNIYTNVPFDRVLDLNDVMDYLNKNPQVLKINQKCVQLNLNSKIIDQINKQFKDNIDEIRTIKKELYSLTK